MANIYAHGEVIHGLEDVVGRLISLLCLAGTLIVIHYVLGIVLYVANSSLFGIGSLDKAVT